MPGSAVTVLHQLFRRWTARNWRTAEIAGQEQDCQPRMPLLEERDFNCTVVPQHKPGIRIEAARVRFNRFWFDAKGCERGIEVLRMYRAKYDDKNNALSTVPQHDWASHGADAFGYGVMGAEEASKYDMPQIDASWVR